MKCKEKIEEFCEIVFQICVTAISVVMALAICSLPVLLILEHFY